MSGLRPVALPAALLIAAAISVGGCANGSSLQLDQLLQVAGVQMPAAVDTGTVAAGLKEALRVGTERTVDSTSAANGFFGNELIRLALPDELTRTGNALRAIGFGAQVDELELAMNRAAEQASAEATPVFVDAIGEMSFTDARSILQGPDDAATSYFQTHTSEALRERFSPIVDQSMEQVGLARVYDQVKALSAGMPFAASPQLDLNRYVTDRTLDGLFSVLRTEETRIREDPAARSTDLLRKVFAGKS